MAQYNHHFLLPITSCQLDGPVIWAEFICVTESTDGLARHWLLSEGLIHMLGSWLAVSKADRGVSSVGEPGLIHRTAGGMVPRERVHVCKTTASFSCILFSTAGPKGSQIQRLRKSAPSLDERSSKCFWSGLQSTTELRNRNKSHQHMDDS